MEIWAIIKTIPVLASILETLLQSYQSYQVAQITNVADSKKEEINLVMEKIKNAKTNEERRLLLRILGKLQ
jgi:predicted Zn-ribbon and HTH transcriptional regulator